MESHHRPIPRHRLRHAKAMRHIATDAEKKLWRLLRSRQLDEVKFRRQAPIADYIVDFACHEKRLVVEVDGGQHADNAKDVERDWRLAAAVYRVLRFWNNDVLGNPNGVLEAIVAELSSSPTK